LACHQKALQPTIPDSPDQVSSNKLTYRGSYSNEFKRLNKWYLCTYSAHYVV